MKDLLNSLINVLIALTITLGLLAIVGFIAAIINLILECWGLYHV